MSTTEGAKCWTVENNASVGEYVDIGLVVQSNSYHLTGNYVHVVWTGLTSNISKP